MDDPVNWHQMVNTGALAAFAVVVVYGIWRLVASGGTRALALGERYVSSTEKLHDTLRESDSRQKELCESHRQTLEVMAEAVDENTVIQREQCQHLKMLVDLHKSPTGEVSASISQIHALHQDMGRRQKTVSHYCDMCRLIGREAFPAIADKLDKHCTEIERLVHDSGPIDLDK